MRLRELMKLKTVIEAEIDEIVTNLSKEPDYWPSDKPTTIAPTLSNIQRRCRGCDCFPARAGARGISIAKQV
jgi:hypothetical protein